MSFKGHKKCENNSKAIWCKQNGINPLNAELNPICKSETLS